MLSDLRFHCVRILPKSSSSVLSGWSTFLRNAETNPHVLYFPMPSSPMRRRLRLPIFLLPLVFCSNSTTFTPAAARLTLLSCMAKLEQQISPHSTRLYHSSRLLEKSNMFFDSGIARGEARFLFFSLLHPNFSSHSDWALWRRRHGSTRVGTSIHFFKKSLCGFLLDFFFGGGGVWVVFPPAVSFLIFDFFFAQIWRGACDQEHGVQGD